MWKLPISALLGVIVAGKIILGFLGWLVWRTYRRGNAQGGGPRPSQAGVIGLQGKALTDIKREGRVLVRGEYWWARAHSHIPAGENVRVIGIDGMWLEVEAYRDKAAIPRPVSAVFSSDTDIQ